MRWHMRYLVLAVLIAGCGGGSDDGAGGAGGAGDADAGGADSGLPGDQYVAGLTKDGADGHFKITLMDATPAPPERGDNHWVIQVDDLAGHAQVGCAIAVEPKMPAHGHGTNKAAMVTHGDEPGQYVLDPVNLFMPGLWEVKIKPTCAGITDQATFMFWIEG